LDVRQLTKKGVKEEFLFEIEVFGQERGHIQCMLYIRFQTVETDKRQTK